jgi:DNA-binding MarR family transcriptional regulator
MTKGLSPDSLLISMAEKEILAIVTDAGNKGIGIEEIVGMTGSDHIAVSNILRRLKKSGYISLRSSKWYSNLEAA